MEGRMTGHASRKRSRDIWAASLVLCLTLVLPGCGNSNHGSPTPRPATPAPGKSTPEDKNPGTGPEAADQAEVNPPPSPVYGNPDEEPDRRIPESTWEELARTVFPAGLPNVQRRLTMGLFEQAWKEGKTTLSLRSSRLSRMIDVPAAIRFVRQVHDDGGINPVNAVCTLYQLGDPLRDADELTRGLIWRMQTNPYILFTSFLATRRSPDPNVVGRAVQFFYKELLELAARTSDVVTLSERFEAAVRLEALRILRAPIPPELVQILSRRLDSLPDSEDFPPERMATLSWKAHLGTVTNADRAWLEAFIAHGWNGRSFPEEGCGHQHCATKYLLRVVALSFLLDVDLGRTRATQMAAYVVALQNPDGSFRTDLEGGALEKSVDPLLEFRCSEFCQIHEWRYINTLSYLAERYDLEPEEVRRAARMLQGETKDD